MANELLAAVALIFVHFLYEKTQVSPFGMRNSCPDDRSHRCSLGTILREDGRLKGKPPRSPKALVEPIERRPTAQRLRRLSRRGVVC